MKSKQHEITCIRCITLCTSFNTKRILHAVQRTLDIIPSQRDVTTVVVLQNALLDMFYPITRVKTVSLESPISLSDSLRHVLFLLGFYAAFNIISVISRRQFTYSRSLGKQASTRLENVPCLRGLNHDGRAATVDRTRDTRFQIPDANHSTTADSLRHEVVRASALGAGKSGFDSRSSQIKLAAMAFRPWCTILQG